MAREVRLVRAKLGSLRPWTFPAFGGRYQHNAESANDDPARVVRSNQCYKLARTKRQLQPHDHHLLDVSSGLTDLVGLDIASVESRLRKQQRGDPGQGSASGPDTRRHLP